MPQLTFRQIGQLLSDLQIMNIYLTFDVEIWCGGWDDLDSRFPSSFQRYVYGRSRKGDYALPKTLEKIDSMVRGNMGMCITSVMGAIASMEDTEFHQRSRKLTTEGREYVCAELKKQGFNYVPSYTSFILFPIEMNGAAFLKKMMESGVAVRSFEIDAKTYCRVSVGLPDELKLFTESLKKVLA